MFWYQSACYLTHYACKAEALTSFTRRLLTDHVRAFGTHASSCSRKWMPAHLWHLKHALNSIIVQVRPQASVWSVPAFVSMLASELCMSLCKHCASRRTNMQNVQVKYVYMRKTSWLFMCWAGKRISFPEHFLCNFGDNVYIEVCAPSSSDSSRTSDAGRVNASVVL